MSHRFALLVAAAGWATAAGQGAKPPAPWVLTELQGGDKYLAYSAAVRLSLSDSPPIGDLVEVVMSADDGLTRRAAGYALKRIGGPARPALMAAVVTERGRRCERAVVALGRFGPAARPAAPTLAGLVGSPDPYLAKAAADALVRLGPAARPGLSGLSRSGDATARELAASALARLDPPVAREDLEKIIDRLSGRAGVEAVRSVARAAAAAKGSIPSLVRLAGNDPNRRVRLAAVRVLGEIGSASGDVVPTLVEGLQARDRRISEAASESLAKIGRRAVPRLVQMLKSGRGQFPAAYALGEIGPAAKAAAPELSAALAGADTWFKPVVVRTLAKIDPTRPAVVPALAAFLKKRNGVSDARPSPRYLSVGYYWLRCQDAADLLADVGPPAAGAVPALVDLARRGTPAERAAAGIALGRIGRGAATAASTLRSVLKGDTGLPGRLRARVAAALMRVAPEGADINSLVKTFPEWSDDEGTRADVFSALSEVGTKATSAVPTLLRAVKDGDAEARRRATALLSRVAPRRAVADALPALMDDLRSGGDIAAAVQALRWLGPLGAAALVRATAEGPTSSRVAAACALAEIEPGAVPAAALPAVIEAAGGLNDGGRMAARATLEKVTPDLAELLDRE